MPASDAQIAANRLNAQRSTGPRTAEGKDQSRRNALKHGLTATVVIPGEEQDEAASRVAAMQRSLARDDDGVALILAERAGYLSMRLKRCYRHEEAMIAERVRNAEADHDDRRRAAAEQVLGGLAAAPPTAARRLRGTPEGVDLLVGRLEGLLGQVDARWSAQHADRFDEAIGVEPGATPRSRIGALTDLATRGDASGLEPGEVAAIPPADRAAWALAEIAGEVAAELARLRDHRGTLDHERFAASRAEAAQRAVQGDDKQTALAKKYEAAAERAFHRTFRQIEAYRRDQERARAEEQAAERALLEPIRVGGAAGGDDRLAAGPGSGSFVPPRRPAAGPGDAAGFAVGRAPTAPPAPPQPPGSAR